MGRGRRSDAKGVRPEPCLGYCDIGGEEGRGVSVREWRDLGSSSESIRGQRQQQSRGHTGAHGAAQGTSSGDGGEVWRQPQRADLGFRALGE